MPANRSTNRANRIKPLARHTDNAANNLTKGILPVHGYQRKGKRHGERRTEKRKEQKAKEERVEKEKKKKDGAEQRRTKENRRK